jgi:hypothetical protein
VAAQPDPPNTISTHFVPQKMSFLNTLDMLREAANICFSAGFERGVIETLNMMIRACVNVSDLHLIKGVYKLQAACYAHFRQEEMAFQALEKLKDLSEDASDYHTLLYVWQGMAEMLTKQKNKSQEALYCL